MPPAYEAAPLVDALRAAGRAGPDADPRPVVAAADALVQAPPDIPLARRIATGTGQPTRAEHIAQAIVQAAMEDAVIIPGGEDDPHRPLRRWAIDHHLCTEKDLLRVWLARALRWGQNRGWLPAVIWDDVNAHVDDLPVVRALLVGVQRGEPEGGEGVPHA